MSKRLASMLRGSPVEYVRFITKRRGLHIRDASIIAFDSSIRVQLQQNWKCKSPVHGRRGLTPWVECIFLPSSPAHPFVSSYTFLRRVEFRFHKRLYDLHPAADRVPSSMGRRQFRDIVPGTMESVMRVRNIGSFIRRQRYTQLDNANS